ncbi:tandem-95 repeat protein [Catalinimonas niigatensis]|uniref:tandem-95 repeat protein n=1 Tax=Catalinimonas niigatensis TaxID=1397264 RepID=UPI00266611E2|nr:tandem-95 repeat protein [Catalinimonas niigatensis]WPP50133.1 tandem-95 repeat protein [Catalinimonas niigatensis]
MISNLELNGDIIEENQPEGSRVGTITAQGPADFSLADENSPFFIDNNQLLTNQAFNYEEQNTYTITIIATDRNTAEQISEEFIISVLDVNDAPQIIAQDQNVGTDENTSISIELSASDEDGDALTYIIESQPSNGTLNQNGELPGNEVIYTPNENFNGSDSFTFRVNDGIIDSDTVATVGIQVNVVNDAPSFSINADPVAVEVNAGPQTVNNFATTVNDGDPDIDQDLEFVLEQTGGELSFVGAASINEQGTLTYETAEDATGSATFEVYLQDNGTENNQSETQTFTITVNEVENATPVASNVSVTTEQDTQVTITLPAEDADEDDLTFEIVDSPDNGTLGSVSGNQVAYTPNAGFFGEDTFTFLANDSNDDSNTATVTITVNEAVSIEPTFTLNPEELELEEDFNNTATVNLTPETDTEATYSLGNDVNFATLSFNANTGTVSVSSLENAFGGPAEISITATDVNNEENTFTASFSLQVTPENDAPVVVNPIGNRDLNENAEAFNINISNVFEDVEDNNLNITGSSGNTELVEVNINGVNLNINITPDAFGSALITLTAEDDEGERAETSFTINVAEEEDATPFFTLIQEVFEVNEDFDQIVSVEVQPEDESQEVSYSISPPSLDFASLTADNSNGIYGFSSLDDRNGEQNFTITAENEQGDTYQENFIFRVNAVNDQPIFELAQATVTADIAAGNLSFTDFATNILPGPVTATDEQAQALAFAATAADPSLFDGQPAISNEGTLTFTPADDNSGNTSVEVTLTDNINQPANQRSSRTTTFNIEVIEQPNAVPEAISDSEETNEDVAVEITLQGSDDDLGDVLTYTIESLPNNGALSVNGNPIISAPTQIVGNTVTYTPDANYNGTDNFTFSVSDGTDSDNATIELTVNPVNDAPVFTLQNNSLTVPFNTTTLQTIDDFATVIDDGDPELNQTLEFGLTPDVGNTLTFSQEPSIDEEGTLSFQLADNASGTAGFTIVLEDKGAQGGSNVYQSAPQGFTITVEAPVVESPTTITLNPGSPTVAENQGSVTVGTLTANGTAPISFSLPNGQGNNNLFSINGNELATTGPLNFENAPSLSVLVQASNSAGNTTQTFPITVGNVEEPPTDIALSSNTVANGAAAGTTVGILSATGGATTEISFSLPEGEDNASFTIQDGNELTTAEIFNFAEQETYSVLVRGSGDGTYDETFSITVTPPDNTAPVATNVAGITTQQATAVTITLTATDADTGDALTYSIVTQPSNGSLGPISGNQLTYTPNSAFFGNDTFTFQANDGTVNSNTATVAIAINGLPIANAGEDQSVLDSDNNGTQTVTLDASSSSDEDGSIVSYVWTEGGSQIATGASPSVNLAVGPHTITLTVTDDDAATSTDQVTITVNAPSAPAFTIDPASFSEEEDFSGTQTLTIIPNTGTPAASYSFDPALNNIGFANLSFDAGNREISISAVENAFGTEEITVTATDPNNGNTATQSLTITVDPVNDIPTVTTIPNITVEESAPNETITLSDYFSDVEDANLSFTVESISNQVLLSAAIDENTSVLTLNFNDDVAGSTSIEIRGTDSEGASVVATFNVEITNVNDAPVISGQAAPITINEDTPITIALNALTVSDVDHPNSELTLTVQDGTNYSRNGNTIIPATNYNGPLTVPVQVSDPEGLQSNIFNLTITVTPVNDAPVASTIEGVTVNEDAAPVTIDLAPYFSDVDDTELSYSVVSNSRTNLVTTSVQGSNLQLTFVPNSNGNATINIQASDGEAVSNPNLVLAVTVNLVNDSPVITGTNPIVINEDETYTIPFSAFNVTDPDNNYPTGFIISLRSGNNYTLQNNNTAILPNQDFFGTLSVPAIVNDGQNNSNEVILTVTVQNVNDAPILTLGNTAPISYSRNDPPVNIASTLSITDIDNSSLQSATVSFGQTAPFYYNENEDLLEYITTGGINGVWDAVNGVLTLSGEASISNYISTISSITYVNQQSDPVPNPRELNFTVNDGDQDSPTIIRYIVIDGSNIPPQLADFERQIPEDEPLSFTVSDFRENYTDDIDEFNNIIYITRLPDPETGTLQVNNRTLTDNDLDPSIGGYLINFNQISSFQYVPRTDFNGTDSFRWVALDNEIEPGYVGNAATVFITVLPVNDAPRITLPSSVIVNENTPFNFSDTRRITIESVDNLTDTLTVTMSVQEGVLNFSNTGLLDALVFVEGDGIDDATIEFRGTEADINTALANLQYKSREDFSGNDAITISASDPQNNTANATVSISISQVNQSPTLANIESDPINYNEESDPVQISNTISIEDRENNNIIAATISISENFVAGEDLLTFSPVEGISGRVSENRLILTGDAPISSYETLLRSIRYANSSTLPQEGVRRVNFQVTDENNGSSNVLSRLINVSRINGPLQLANIETDPLIYEPGDPQQVITQSLTVSDADEEALTSAVIRFAEEGYVLQQDVLVFENDAFEVDWDETQGILTLSGDNSAQAYQDALRSIAYLNTSAAPTLGSRVISFAVYRNEIVSNMVEREVRVSQNALPVLTDFSIDLLKNSSYTFSDADFSNHYNDPDNSPENLTFVRLRISELPVRGQLYLNEEVITQEILDTEGAIEVNIEELGQLVYQPEENYTGMDSLVWNAYDGENYAAANAKLIFNISDLEVDAGTDLEICQGDPVVLNVRVSGGSGNYTFTWTCDQANCMIDNANAAEVSVSPTGNTTYFVTVTDENGVTSNSDTIIVNTIECYGLPLDIPTAFTPNGDGSNDLWVITNIETYQNQVVEVYDRYGKQVFFSEDYRQSWDGARNGQRLPAGTYYYLIKLNNGERNHRGSVSILK